MKKTNANGGFEYEQKVIRCLIEQNINGNITSGAGSSAASADADMKIGDQIHKLEIKMNTKSQMGGTSISYQPDNKAEKKFFVVSDTLDEELVSKIEEAVIPMEKDLKVFLEAVGATKFPASVDKLKWKKAKNEGLLKPLNAKVKATTQFIHSLYEKKGVYYIQIGGAGLFYLSKNPANLPIPQFQGEIDIEIRPGRSGSKINSDGISLASGGLRIQGRLKFDCKSNYTLDNDNSIKKMLNNINY
jgi:hypothetical protein